jgi:GNAT superfamily N-acetyltransferase
MATSLSDLDVIAQFDRASFGLVSSTVEARSKVRLSRVRTAATVASIDMAWLFQRIWGIETRPTFNWAAVHAFHPTATTLLVHDTHEPFALMQVHENRIMPCLTGSRSAVVYVSFLEVSPKLRAQAGERSRRFGFGAFLLGVACERAMQLGLDGRLGLHATPAAEGFYERQGFTRHDCPNEYHEVYFELSGDAATSFLSRGR